jgi:plasmid stabilization system protein ParE
VFLEGRAGDPFTELLDQLFGTVLPNLERFPDIGRDFLGRQPSSVEGAAALARVRTRLGDGAQLREYITGEYLVLYAVVGDRVHVLAIKHHRQLTFDLRGHW